MGSIYDFKRKIHDKIWATKESQRSCIGKRTMSVKKVMYVIFFTDQGPAIRITVSKGKYINANFYKGMAFINKRNILKTVDKQMVSMESGCCMTMLRHTKRVLYENI
jgi:hypothetical protein